MECQTKMETSSRLPRSRKRWTTRWGIYGWTWTTGMYILNFFLSWVNNWLAYVSSCASGDRAIYHLSLGCCYLLTSGDNYVCRMGRMELLRLCLLLCHILDQNWLWRFGARHFRSWFNNAWSETCDQFCIYSLGHGHSCNVLLSVKGRSNSQINTIWGQNEG